MLAGGGIDWLKRIGILKFVSIEIYRTKKIIISQKNYGKRKNSWASVLNARRSSDICTQWNLLMESILIAQQKLDLTIYLLLKKEPG